MKARSVLIPAVVGGIVIAGGGLGLVVASATSASATDLPACTTDQRSQVHAERVGPASFSIYADAPLECGAWVSTFSFDDGYVPTSADDYRHPQTAIDWSFAQLTTEPTVFSVPVPECGPFQSDVYVGDLVLNLADGELGDKWRAGGVVLDNPVCEAEVPPVVVPPTDEPTPPVTAPPTDEPTTPPTGEPTEEPTAPVTTTPVVEPTATPTPEVTPTAAPVVLTPEPTSTATAAPSARLAATPDGLAYTGTSPWLYTAGAGALALVAGGILLLVRRRRITGGAE